jgi:hypothetical protein
MAAVGEKDFTTLGRVVLTFPFPSTHFPASHIPALHPIAQRRDWQENE